MFHKSKVVDSIEKAVIDDVIAPYLTLKDKLNDDFLLSRLSPFSKPIKTIILQKSFAQQTVFERNKYIRESTDRLYALLPEKLAHLFFSSDDDIKVFATKCSDACRNIIIDPINEMLLTLTESKTVNENNRAKLSEKARTDITTNSVNGNSGSLNPVNGNGLASLTFAEKEQNFVYERACRYTEMFNIDAPTPTNRKHISGCIKRMADKRWWLRRFRKLITQANEKAAILFNFVNRRKQIYASNLTTRNRQTRLLENTQLMSAHFIINEAGQRYSLQEVSDLNVSNPKVRKAELINRARGFEDLSKSLDHQGLFITITCPSKYHRAFSKSGTENPKWKGLMPDDAQLYLNKLWARIRAQLKRENISPYGFRVVEPQHDGTPHWHSLLFVKLEHVERLEKIINFYALEEDGDEKGAQENRCDVKLIDPAKGSATGYILKYIVKNIDGEGLGEDKFGNDAISTAMRINAWASCWCIRQFQQIGGASVSVWRELRRLNETLFPDSLMEKARVAADTSDWAGYINAMGGIESPRKDHPIKLHYDININLETGECAQSYYDGEVVTKMKGLLFDGNILITRKHTWRLERVG
jgi:hypothetical protein